MADLHACYFCGAAGGTALESYPVVPDALASETDTESPPSVVLCPGCKTKLDDVLEAAFASVEGSPAGEPPEDPPWGSHAGVPGAVSPDERAAGGRDSEPATTESSAASTESDEDTEPTGSIEETAIEGEEAAGGEQAVVEEETAGEGETADTEETADAEAEAAPSETAASRPIEDLPPVTPTTRKVIRLVQNRSFPLDRNELEDVAQSAYELSREEATDAVDTIVAHGVLEADGDELRKP